MVFFLGYIVYHERQRVQAVNFSWRCCRLRMGKQLLHLQCKLNYLIHQISYFRLNIFILLGRLWRATCGSQQRGVGAVRRDFLRQRTLQGQLLPRGIRGRLWFAMIHSYQVFHVDKCI